MLEPGAPPAGADIDALLHQTLLGDAWDHAAVAAAVFSDDGRYIACNEAFCGLTGYDRDEVGRLRVGVDLAADEQQNAKLFGEIVAGRRTVGTAGLRRKDGSEVAVSFWAIATRAATLPYYVVLYWPASSRPKRRGLPGTA
jgi:PAS domain S-box-containing protein